jgi:hypothetical protein
MSINGFAAYSDDSGSEGHRYRSLCTVSSKKTTLSQLRNSLSSILHKENVSELKFEETRGHSPKIRAASSFYNEACNLCARKQIRIDVVVWDQKDSRHLIPMRDDTANIERMYHKLILHMARMWNQCEWDIFPDVQSGVDWKSLQTFLNYKRLKEVDPNTRNLFKEENPFLNVQKPIEQESIKEPLVQLADMFGGLARFSVEKGNNYHQWKLSKEAVENPGLFSFEIIENPDESKADRARFSLLREFDTLCKSHRLGVSLETKKCLWTPRPSGHLNFWSYKPQGEYDKAPVKTQF